MNPSSRPRVHYAAATSTAAPAIPQASGLTVSRSLRLLVVLPGMAEPTSCVLLAKLLSFGSAARHRARILKKNINSLPRLQRHHDSLCLSSYAAAMNHYKKFRRLNATRRDTQMKNAQETVVLCCRRKFLTGRRGVYGASPKQEQCTVLQLVHQSPEPQRPTLGIQLSSIAIAPPPPSPSPSLLTTPSTQPALAGDEWEGFDVNDVPPMHFMHEELFPRAEPRS